jgi:hypothetical protein
MRGCSLAAPGAFVRDSELMTLAQVVVGDFLPNSGN